MSTTSESQPAWAMTSAEKLDGMPSQLLTTARPSAQISRTPFARAMGSLQTAALSFSDPASYGGMCQAPSAGAASSAHDPRERLATLKEPRSQRYSKIGTSADMPLIFS